METSLSVHFLPQVTLTRSPPCRSADDQGEGLLLNSYDRTLVIKQISSEEVADVHNILSEYHQVALRSLLHRGFPGLAVCVIFLQGLHELFSFLFFGGVL